MAQLAGREDSLVSAKFLPPKAIRLRFKDGLDCELLLSSLEMDDDQIVWSSVAASATGESMVAKTKRGEDIPIDAGTLRYLADPDYAREVDRKLKGLQLTSAELDDFVRDNPPPPELFHK
ncbi:MAG: hypothetical protein WCL32_12760 [Planctomycetota bacterium]